MTETYRIFDTLQDARDYRYQHGTGGWIFSSAASGQAILFPPHITPSTIFHHPLTKGRTGRLIGSM